MDREARASDYAPNSCVVVCWASHVERSVS